MVRLALNLLLSVSLLVHNGSDEKTISWSAERKLTWDDFKIRPDANATNAALTTSNVGFKYSYDGQKGFKYSITCVFDKNSSWGRIKTDYILAHEQAHFDIAEIYARKLYKEMKAYTFNSAKAQQEIPAIYRKTMKELADRQQEYDRESDYSRNKEEQANWLAKIRKELDELKDYANYPQA